MKKIKILTILILFTFLFSTTSTVSFAEENIASDITKQTEFSSIGFNEIKALTDGDTNKYIKSNQNAQLTLKNNNGINGIYLIIGEDYPEFTIINNDTKTEKSSKKSAIAHRYIDISSIFGACPKSITLSFQDSILLSEITVFSQGILPKNIQNWQEPIQNGADILLFSTHGDDEQLFFAGLIPLYAVEKNARVQVVYMTSHPNDSRRMHEMLNGLWAVGCKYYPVFGNFADFRIDDIEGTYKKYESLGVTREALQGFVVEQIRRFKPLVVIGHDIKGEYGHGMHMVYSDLVQKSVELSADNNVFLDSVQKYDVWTVEKTYLHLYENNKIIIDYDIPLNSFNQMTAFEVSQKLGYPCHISQQYTWFNDWINGKNKEISKASQIKKYSPCEFGLYKSTVGQDILKNDFLENITTYEQREIAKKQELVEQQKSDKIEVDIVKKKTLALPITIFVSIIICLFIFIAIKIIKNRKK